MKTYLMAFKSVVSSLICLQMVLFPLASKAITNFEETVKVEALQKVENQLRQIEDSLMVVAKGPSTGNYFEKNAAQFQLLTQIEAKLQSLQLDQVLRTQYRAILQNADAFDEQKIDASFDLMLSGYEKRRLLQSAEIAQVAVTDPLSSKKLFNEAQKRMTVMLTKLTPKEKPEQMPMTLRLMKSVGLAALGVVIAVAAVPAGLGGVLCGGGAIVCFAMIFMGGAGLGATVAGAGVAELASITADATARDQETFEKKYRLSTEEALNKFRAHAQPISLTPR